jgi:uncharacterized protein (TIGR03083 family)
VSYIDEQRVDFADFFDTLTPEQWQTPSLCAEWTVREVAAHLTHSTTNWGRLNRGVAAIGSPVHCMHLRATGSKEVNRLHPHSTLS